ncbi:radical SAM family heme chaperone HemW [Ponticaulis sp.]|uniref:radical SAM family heme chaperone HemW n=1 Tax=Ponticaulis sp. TaxID=2020902 RepID=UPI000B6F5E2F|nr:radical SAM family heme chaperone HemW [Ponticaulis sp.]MAJ09495.1 coproporphyrinogen III oxidase [Ponticaulis sp.]RPG18840.1 MAG: radical SAM family heme chaperone HemW [Hyphomonadaceae bacterium TMED125]HBH90922.1 coproporphyrinogen III oxidase [Hyphomonadaceae bacterium]HBJ93246.1 coproporphyrinogen III oxidase [Hyphomonadaceae bacterium]|tara:strand:- start:16321 stop:17484 length:1164 start_codon:yes stop_codon:yes gene_type:complete
MSGSPRLPDELFGIYVHWPYCAKICPYCDFNVYAAKSRDNSALEAAILKDIEGYAASLTDRTLTSLYFGGGTPSLCTPSFLSEIIETSAARFAPNGDIEITLEANPEDITPERLKAWKGAGVNRLSLGVQALNDDALRFLGRNHTRDEARGAIDAALNVFPNTSIDLIYARPGQSIPDWLEELDRALSTGAPHLSLYELTIKEKTAFAKQVERERFIPLDEDEQADLYIETLKLTAERGLPAYEVSNHARSEDYWSRHNLTYWLNGEWLGIGPGAEGKLELPDGRTTTIAEQRVPDYISAVEARGIGSAETFSLTGTEAAEEAVILGLRSKRGVDRASVEALLGAPLNACKIESFKEYGQLLEEAGRISLTEKGWLLADYIAGEILP